MEAVSMEVLDGAIAALKASKEENIMYHTTLQAFKELREFKELELSVEQLKEIDRLYADKCREVVRNERDIEKRPARMKGWSEMGNMKKYAEKLQDTVFNLIRESGVNPDVICKVEEYLSDIESDILAVQTLMIDQYREIVRLSKETTYQKKFLWEKWENMLQELSEGLFDDLADAWEQFKGNTTDRDW